MSPCCLFNEEFCDYTLVLLFLFQNIGESVLSSLVLEKGRVEDGGWFKESFCNWDAKGEGMFIN
jgi:hypothetical protein